MQILHNALPIFQKLWLFVILFNHACLIIYITSYFRYKLTQKLYREEERQKTEGVAVLLHVVPVMYIMYREENALK